MKNFKEKFGKKLTQIRKKCGLSQEALAESVGIAPRNLSKIETGVTFPSIENLEKIITALNCKTSELFDFEHLANAVDLRQEINNKIENLDSDKLSILYKFLSAIEE